MSRNAGSSGVFDDTIVAVITPPGEGGVAGLRLAGQHSLSIFLKHFSSSKIISYKDKSYFQPFLMRYGYFVSEDQEILDEIMAVYMPKGNSYTGEEQVEIFCHGGRQIVRQIQSSLLSSGARAAEPGEFTKLAFLNGRIDLAKAESVASIISSNTENSYSTAKKQLLGAYSEHISMLREQLVELIADIEASVDYPEDEIEESEQEKLLRLAESIQDKLKELIESYKGGRILQEGFTIAVAGRPNAGKSSLFNLMLRQERALVTSTAGTTRDYLSEWVDIGGYKVQLVDTAGLRKSGGMIEKAGQESARKVIESSDLVLWLVDISKKGYTQELSYDIEQLGNKDKMLLYNKIDLLSGDFEKPEITSVESVSLSCKTGSGFDELERKIIEQIERNMPDLTSGLVVTSARHKQKLEAASRYIKDAHKKIREHESPELTAFDLRTAVGEIDEITGKVYNEEILGKIFSKFCIGK